MITTLVILVGGLYLWGAYLANHKQETTSPTLSAETLGLTEDTASQSDEISAIKADFEAIDMGSLEAELETIGR